MKGPTTEGKEENPAENTKNPSQQMLNTGSSSVLLAGAAEQDGSYGGIAKKAVIGIRQQLYATQPKGFKYQTQLSTLENQLRVLSPDEWNNIPICVVNAFKYVMVANEENFKNFKIIDNKLEVIKQSITNQGNKFDADLKVRDELLRKEIKAVHTNITEGLDAKFTDVYNMQKFSQQTIDRQLAEFTKTVNTIDRKCSHMIRDQNTKYKEYDDHMEKLQEDFDKNKQQVSSRFDQLIEDNFKIPDILTDENFQPVSFRDFMTSNLVSLAGQLKKLEEKCTSEYLVQDVFHDFVKESVPRTDKLYEEIERLNGETLKSDLGIQELHTLIRTQIKPVFIELQKNIDSNHKVHEERFVEEKNDYIKKFIEFERQNQDQFEELAASVRAKIDGYVESIKQSFQMELKSQLNIHRKNMIDAVETKCFEIDKDYDSLKQTLGGFRLIPINVKDDLLGSSGDEKFTPREEEEYESGQEFPKDQIKKSNGRYTKVLRVALNKSIDKYREIRSRLEALESQITVLLDGAYNEARSQVKSTQNQSNVEKNQVKSQMIGVKKILEEKKVADINISTHKKKIEKLDQVEIQRVSPMMQGADDELFQKLFKMPESSYQEFKVKHQAAKKAGMHPLRIQMQANGKNFASTQAMDLKIEGHSVNHAQTMLSGLDITEENISPNYQGRSMSEINQMKVFQLSTVSPFSNPMADQLMSQMIDLRKNQIAGGGSMFDNNKSSMSQRRKIARNELIVSNLRLTSDNNTTLSGTGTHHLRGRTSINTPLNNASTLENRNQVMSHIDLMKERGPRQRPQTSKQAIGVNYIPLNDLNRFGMNP